MNVNDIIEFINNKDTSDSDIFVIKTAILNRSKLSSDDVVDYIEIASMGDISEIYDVCKDYVGEPEIEYDIDSFIDFIEDCGDYDFNTIVDKIEKILLEKGSERNLPGMKMYLDDVYKQEHWDKVKDKYSVEQIEKALPDA